mmetsp:Transcript_37315/g.119706  ORF Transcript_37315/g.119706 Transcript_37315/m.119706 type:complete len:228 (+) Transcript_37315:83-766(+)
MLLVDVVVVKPVVVPLPLPVLALPVLALVVLRMPLRTSVAASATPTTGLTTRPRTPFPTPLRAPAAPPSSAPRMGAWTRPVTPSTTPPTAESKPRARPSKRGGVRPGSWRDADSEWDFEAPFLSIRRRRYWSSRVRWLAACERPPVMFARLSAVPPTVCRTRLDAPRWRPKAKASGRSSSMASTRPSTGSRRASSTPRSTPRARPRGFPRARRLPAICRAFRAAPRE